MALLGPTAVSTLSRPGLCGVVAAVPFAPAASALRLSISAAISCFTAAITGASRSAFKAARRRAKRFRVAQAYASKSLCKLQPSHTWVPFGRLGCRLHAVAFEILLRLALCTLCAFPSLPCPCATRMADTSVCVSCLPRNFWEMLPCKFLSALVTRLTQFACCTDPNVAAPFICLRLFWKGFLWAPCSAYRTLPWAAVLGVAPHALFANTGFFATLPLPDSVCFDALPLPAFTTCLFLQVLFSDCSPVNVFAAPCT